MATSTMKAIKVVDTGKAEVQTVPLPKLRDTSILVKVKAVALNPTDWKHIDMLPTVGATVGCDYAGEVVEVGSKVTKAFKKGDRVAGVAHGVNALQKEDGCFAEYAVPKGDIAIRIPDNLTYEEAATLGVGVTTVGQGLYQSLGLPLPGSGEKSDEPVLIYGGSTATGTLAIQYAALSGAKVITTCSPHNYPLVKSLGAEAAFDYRDPDVVKKIKDYTGNALTKVFDTISEGESPKISSEAVSSKGGHVSYLMNAKHERTDVKNSRTIAYTANGAPIHFRGQDIPAKREDFDFAVRFWNLSAELLADGKIKVHPPEVGKNGLAGVLDGLQLLREGKVSGKKLVYKVEETP